MRNESSGNMGKDNKKDQQITSGFTQAGVYARRQFCGNLEVYRPLEHLWNPRLREAATTLCAMRGQRSGTKTNIDNDEIT